MNEIDILYKNFNFTSTACNKNILEDYDVPIFASDAKLSKLFKKASVTNSELQKKMKFGKKSSPQVESVFEKHPRNFNDDAFLSSDSSDTITDEQIIETKFKQHKKTINNFKKQVVQNYEYDKVSHHMESYYINNDDIEIEDENIISKQTQVDLNDKIIDNINLNKKRNHTEVDVYKEDILGVNLSSILIKISSWIDELVIAINNGFAPIDGAENYLTRETRVKEFAIRFARQYEYELGRQLGNLRSYLPRLPTNRLYVPRVAQTLTKSCHIILQAIMQYTAHIPTTLIFSPLDKKQNNIHVKFYQTIRNISDLLAIVKKLSNDYSDIKNSAGAIEEVDEKCELLAPLIQDKFMRNPVTKPKPKPKPIKKPVKKITAKENINHYDDYAYQKPSMESRFAMYSMTYKKRPGKRLNVQSRYKTAGIVKPPNPTINDQQKNIYNTDKKRILAQKRSSQIIDDGSYIIEKKIDEDDIETMVQKITENRSEEKELSLNKELRDRIENLLQNWLEMSKDLKDDPIHKEILLSQMLNLIEQVQWANHQETTENDGHLVQQVVNEDIINKRKTKQHTKTHVSITGSKNAKLIIMKDKSMYETDIVNSSEPELIKLKNVPAKQEIVNNVDQHGQKINKKKILSKQKEKSLINILTYRKEYQNFTSHNPMYRKGRVQPWHVTNKMSDQLLKNVLNSVLSEINLNQIVNQIYRAEFV